MNWPYKTFVSLFLLVQSLVIFDLFPRSFTSSYFTEVLVQMVLSISKVNHLYNFFTDKHKVGWYNYTSTNIALFKEQDGVVVKLPVTEHGSIKNLVRPVNAARINNIQSIALTDTLLYNAVVRSEALYFFKRNTTYPLIYVEVLNHRCFADQQNGRFIKREEVDTVYYKYFY